jgi:hypothetical protein
MNNIESTTNHKAVGLNFWPKADKIKSTIIFNHCVYSQERSTRFWKSEHFLGPGLDTFNVWGKIGLLEMRINVTS